MKPQPHRKELQKTEENGEQERWETPERSTQSGVKKSAIKTEYSYYYTDRTSYIQDNMYTQIFLNASINNY